MYVCVCGCAHQSYNVPNLWLAYDLIHQYPTEGFGRQEIVAAPAQSPPASQASLHQQSSSHSPHLRGRRYQTIGTSIVHPIFLLMNLYCILLTHKVELSGYVWIYNHRWLWRVAKFWSDAKHNLNSNNEYLEKSWQQSGWAHCISRPSIRKKYQMSQVGSGRGPRTAKFDPSRLWAKYASFPLYPLLWVRFSSRSDSNVVRTAQGGDFKPKLQWHEYDMNNFWIIIPTLPCAIPLPTTCIRCFNTFCSVASHSRPETLDKRWQDYIEFWNCKIGENMFEQNWTELQQAPIHEFPCKAFGTGTSRDDSISFHYFQISKSVVLKTWNSE